MSTVPVLLHSKSSFFTTPRIRKHKRLYTKIYEVQFYKKFKKCNCDRSCKTCCEN